MQELDLVVRIAEIILFLVLSVLGIYLIISVKKITASVGNIEKDVEELQKKMEPLIDNVTVVTKDIQEISTSVKEQITKVDGVIDTVKETIDSVKETTDSIIEFEQKTQKEVETQVGDALNFVSAIVTGVKTFISTVSGSNGRPGRNSKLYTSVIDDELTDE